MANILALYDLDRAQLVEICKRVAEPYLEKGETRNAWIAFAQAMKHNGVKTFRLTEGWMWFLKDGSDISVKDLKDFIDGFE